MIRDFFRHTCRAGALACGVAVVAVASASVAAQAQRAVTIAGLGTAAFDTSTHSPEAQQAFMRGLLLLHLFEYRDAANAFVAAEKADPGFAMAYWGEAMTYNHPVWNQVDPAKGRAALEKFAESPAARAARVADARERGYMQAVEILYAGEGTKAERDAHYADAMQRLSEAYPKDDEPRLFYALALLGKSEGVRDVPVYLKAAGLAKSVFERHPRHPGAAHYWIHGMDDPEHAAGALVAARALSAIAPDAPHAQHMCSHIFLALGMWDDVVRANVAATEGSNKQAADAGRPAAHCGHYNFWLLYGLVELGRISEAEKVLSGCHDEARDAQQHTAGGDSMHADSFIDLQSTYLVNVTPPRTSLPATMEVDLSHAPMAEFQHLYAAGLAEAAAGDANSAQAKLDQMTQQMAGLAALFDREGVPADDPGRAEPGIEVLQLQAAVQAAHADLDGAVATLHKALDAGKKLPYAFGPPEPEKPTGELLGEVLLRQGKAAEARAAFEDALKQTPNRALTLLGLARAENAAGDKAAAKETARKLLAMWARSDGAYALRREAEDIAYPGMNAARKGRRRQ